MRSLLTRAVSILLRFTGWRFSKHWRWGTRWYHRLGYSLVCTFEANNLADGPKPPAVDVWDF